MLARLTQHADGFNNVADSLSGIRESLRQELEAINAAIARLTGEAPHPHPEEAKPTA